VVELYDKYVECKQRADDKRAERNASAAKMKGKLEPDVRAVRSPTKATVSARILRRGVVCQ
jgi:hypothetical protein